MTLRTLISSALRNLKRNLNRSVLTMLGIIIGIAAVITIVALGEAYKRDTIESFTGESEGKVVLNVTFIPDSEDLSSINESYFDNGDIDILKHKDYVDSIEFIYDDQAIGDFITGDIRGTQVQGMLGSSEETSYKNIIGRNIAKVDNDRLKNVAVVNESIFPEEAIIDDYLGSIITIENIKYEIIGIVPSADEDEMNLFTLPTSIQIPKKTYEQYNSTGELIYGIQITLGENADVKESTKDIEETLNQGGAQKASGTYEIYDSTGIVKMLGYVINTITTFIAVVAGISLFIAGIGVMNMIYTSVSERNLEIGIKRALGAKKKDIKREFLFEGIIITLMGGFIGYILGVLVAVIISYFLKLEVKPSLSTILMAAGVSIAIGIASSYLPAKAASNQNTVDILK
ncbi:ABC transporter permease [Alloiococcus sp. CFN-8]|uniref:ABC transporter permease n=1 Tax=Alloiococcus sp. CFN-8 TaxID=3416081 RepID=UPI003CF43DF8